MKRIEKWMALETNKKLFCCSVHHGFVACWHEWREPKNGWYLKQTKSSSVAQFTTVLFWMNRTEKWMVLETNKKLFGCSVHHCFVACRHEWREPKNGWYLKQTKSCFVAQFTTVLFWMNGTEKWMVLETNKKLFCYSVHRDFVSCLLVFFCLFGGFLYLWYHHGASHFTPHRCFTRQISDKGLF